MIKRLLEAEIRRRLKHFPVVVLYGPRQCGKTTLARRIAESGKATYFDLEDDASLRRLADPAGALKRLRGLVVIDEVQRLPEIFPLLRVLADRKPLPARFLILGSASGHLLRQTSESLAGRASFVEMGGFNLAETGETEIRRLWWRGRFPRSFLAGSNAQSQGWRNDFIQTFLERDMPQFDVRVPAVVMRRFWMMLAHYHGQTWNGSEIAASLNQAHTTVRRYLDFLTGAMMVRQLQPWHENVGKRQIKSPKIYFRDSGLLHTLLGVSSFEMLEGHPKLGASWEGFAMEEILQSVGDQYAFFWATQSGAELDLLLHSQGRPYGIEIKYSESPVISKSMRVAMTDLKLEHLLVVYPGSDLYPLDDRIMAVPLPRVATLLQDRRRLLRLFK